MMQKISARNLEVLDVIDQVEAHLFNADRFRLEFKDGRHLYRFKLLHICVVYSCNNSHWWGAICIHIDRFV
jgi:hypothetical protein